MKKLLSLFLLLILCLPAYADIYTWAGDASSTGSVTSVGISFSHFPVTISGSPVTSTGTLTLTPSSTKGDIIYAPANNQFSDLAIGSTGQILTIGSGVPAWTTNTYPSTDSSGDLLYASAANTISGLAIGTTNQALVVAAGAPSWANIVNSIAIDGTATVPSLTFSASTGNVTLKAAGTKGDLPYLSANNVGASLGIGSTGNVLTVAGGVPTWAAPATSGTVTSFSAGSLSPIFTTSVATATSTPALTFSLTNAAGYGILSNTSGSAGAPAYNDLTITAGTGLSGGGDLASSPTISLSSPVSAAHGGTGITTVPAKGSVLVGNAGGTAYANLSVGGTNGYVLTVNSSATNGVDWEAAPGTVSSVSNSDGTLTISPTTGAVVASLTVPVIIASGGTNNAGLSVTQGDIMYGDGTKIVGLAVGTSGQLLQTKGASANPAWTTNTYPSTDSTGDIIYASGSNTLTGLAIGTSGQILTVSGGVPSWGSPAAGTVTSFSANNLSTWFNTSVANSTSTPTLSFSPTGSKGDLLYYSAANTAANLAIGTSNQILTVMSGLPTWATISTGSGTVNSGTANCLAYYPGPGSAAVVSSEGDTSITNGALTLGLSTTVAGSLTLEGNTSGTTSGSITLQGYTSGTGIIGVAAAAGSGILFQLPSSNGSSGYYLQTNGSGVTSWQAVTAGVSSVSGDGTLISNSSSTGAVTLTLENAGAGTIWGNWGTSTGAPSYNAVGSAGQIPRVTAGGGIAWTTATYPNTVTSGNVLYASGTNAISGDANANLSAGALTLGVASSAAGTLVLEGSTSGATTIATPATTTSYTLTVPANAGYTNFGNNFFQYTLTDGSGNLSFQEPICPLPPVVSNGIPAIIPFSNYLTQEAAQHVSTTSNPASVCLGNDGSTWYSTGTTKIGKITPGGTATEYSTTSNCEFVFPGPDGNVWYTTSTTEIGKCTPSGTVTEYATTTSTSGGDGCTGPDGNIWYCTGSSKIIGKITTGGASDTEYATTSNCYVPAVGIDGRIWYSTKTTKVGAIDTGGVKDTEYTTTTAAYFIAQGSDGRMWYGTETTEIGALTMTGTDTEYTTTQHPYGLASGPDGKMYFSTATTKMGYVTPLGTETDVTTLDTLSGSTICFGADGTFRAGTTGAHMDYVPFAITPNWISCLNISIGGGGNKLVYNNSNGILVNASNISVSNTGNPGITLEPQTTSGEIQFVGSTSGLCNVTVAAAAGTNTLFQLPSSDGSSGQFLETDGTGVTSWATVSATGGGFGGNGADGAISNPTSNTGPIQKNATTWSLTGAHTYTITGGPTIINCNSTFTLGDSSNASTITNTAGGGATGGLSQNNNSNNRGSGPGGGGGSIQATSAGAGGGGFGAAGGNGDGDTVDNGAGGQPYQSWINGGSGGGGGAGTTANGGNGGSSIIVCAVGAISETSVAVINELGSAGGNGSDSSGGGGSGGLVFLASQTSVTVAGTINVTGGAGGNNGGTGGGGGSGRIVCWSPSNSTGSATFTMNGGASGGGGATAGGNGTEQSITGTPNLPLFAWLIHPDGTNYFDTMTAMEIALGRKHNNGINIMQRDLAWCAGKTLEGFAYYNMGDFKGSTCLGVGDFQPNNIIQMNKKEVLKNAA